VDPETALGLLAAARPELERRFGVVELALFGSIARGEGDERRDVDVLVSFDGPATSAGFFGTPFFLEDLFDRPVDLVTASALRSEFKPCVDRDMMRV